MNHPERSIGSTPSRESAFEERMHMQVELIKRSGMTATAWVDDGFADKFASAYTPELSLDELDKLVIGEPKGKPH